MFGTVEVADRAVAVRSPSEVCVDRLDHVADLPSRLLDVDQAGVFQTFAFDEREEIVVEGDENLVALDGVL